jgi:gamma-glutamyltranspeptidase/glutathione hydrolase
VNGDGAVGEPERVTNTPEDESAPSVAPDGAIAFVRGYGSAARIWVRGADGAEKRLTNREQPELAPAYSPDGSRIAYVHQNESGRRLVVRLAGSARDSVVNADRGAESVAWSPTDDRLVFSATGAGGGVFVTPVDGRYVNLVATRRGDVAWSPDGRTIAVAEHDAVAVGYNGDPDRLGERVAAEAFSSREILALLAAPALPDEARSEARVDAARDRASRNAEAFDRVWERSARLYFAAADAAGRRQQWESLRAKYRPAALAATTDDALELAIHRMVRERPPLRLAATGRAAVSSAHPVSTAAGLEILRAGGNVVDAAVAVSFALGVVEPDASGIGGYGQMVVALTGREKPSLIEFMSRVPEEATLANAALMTNGRYPIDGPVLVNVPGTVAGMHRAWKLWGSGKVAWKDLLAPAIRAARDGYVVSEGLATTLATEREHFARYEGSRALFFRNGKPLVAGDSLRNPDLAWTLERIARDGADGFYKGEVARRLVADLRGKGNAMRLSDLARYFAAEREPVSGTYHGYTLYSSAPPSSGGAGLVAQLNLLEQFGTPKLYTDDAATLHAALSAWLLQPSARGRVADPGLWPVTVEPFQNKDTATARWKCYSPNRALRPTDFRGDTLDCAALRKPAGVGAVPPPGDSGRMARRDSPFAECEAPDHATEISACHASGTTAFTVADADGNAVAVTQTLGTWGGNFYVTPGLGFLYNDKLTSYGTDPSEYGARLPYARHGSTLAPTIVFKGRKPVFAVGAAGNAWITSAVYESLLGSLDFGLDAQQALELPRFLPGGRGFFNGGRVDRAFSVELEDGFAPAVSRRLRELGYDVSLISLKGELRMGYGAAISFDGRKVTAGADPRRAGTAGAIP